jgi:hypothetical protein
MATVWNKAAKVLFCIIAISCCSLGLSFGQIRFPKSFKRISGELGSGRADQFINGKYIFDTNMLLIAGEVPDNLDSVKKYLSKVYGFPFSITKDNICWGTGLFEGDYYYVTVDKSMSLIELYAPKNDQAFSSWSKWLLTTIRKYQRQGKVTGFPLREK